jgi:hypothetical protein
LEPLDKSSVINPLTKQGLKMGPGYFVIAILGCADGGSSCTQVATLQTRYENADQCTAASAAALEANSDFDFPTLLARCRAGSGADRAEAKPDRRIPAGARRS